MSSEKNIATIKSELNRALSAIETSREYALSAIRIMVDVVDDCGKNSALVDALAVQIALGYDLIGKLDVLSDIPVNIAVCE